MGHDTVGGRDVIDGGFAGHVSVDGRMTFGVVQPSLLQVKAEIRREDSREPIRVADNQRPLTRLRLQLYNVVISFRLASLRKILLAAKRLDLPAQDRNPGIHFLRALKNHQEIGGVSLVGGAEGKSGQE